MYEKLETVKIGGNLLPIKCNIGVLAYLQEVYGTLTKFEQKLIGMSPVLDKDGNTVYKSDGSISYSWTEPSISVIKETTPKFIREGIIQAEAQGEDYSNVNWEEAFEDFDFNYIEVALALNTEFQRCFHRKKKTMSSKGTQKKRTTKKSTSTES